MKTNEKQLAIAAAVVIGIAVAWLYVAQPLYRRWADARDRVESLNTSLVKSRELLATRAKLEADKAAIERVLVPPVTSDGGDAFNPADLGNAVIPSFLEHLNSLAKQSGMSIADLRHVPRPTAFESYAELKFELKARASIKQIKEFLVGMTASERYLRVQSMSFHPRENGTIEADFTLLGLATQDALDPEDKDRPGGKKR